jgi:MoaA/NifB/PqqE/SkfB family radical SAM enzyme
MKITNQAIIRSAERRQIYAALLELTYVCNLDCFYCSNDHKSTGKALSLDQYQTLIRDLSREGAFTITLSGGEPLAHPDFLAIGRACRDNGLLTTIKSNGHALSDATIAKIKDDIDPYAIDISLHGSTAAIHDKQTRVPGSFKRLLENIPRIREKGIPVRINITATRWNEHQLEEMANLALSMNCVPNFNATITPRDNGDTTPLSLTPSRRASDLATTLIKRVRAQQKPLNGTASTEASAPFSPKPGDTQCTGGLTSITVDPFGNILPCANWREPIGSLHISSLHDILHSAPRSRVIRINQEVYRRLSGSQDSGGERKRYCIAESLLTNGTYLSE